MRKVILILSLVLAVTSSILTYYLGKKTVGWKHELNDERYLRFSCEESMDAVNNRLKSVEQELISSRRKNESLEKLLKNANDLNSAMKTKIKELNDMSSQN